MIKCQLHKVLGNKFNKHNKSTSQYFSSNYDCNFDRISLDLNGDKIAFTSLCSSLDKNSGADHYNLIILNTYTKKNVKTINCAKAFAFSPDGNSIAYQTSLVETSDAQESPSCREGIWIYNFVSKETLKIDISTGRMAIDINWSEHDGNLYILSREAYRYVVKKAIIEGTPYKGIYFSANGKYYAAKTDEGPSWSIYRTDQNSLMSEWMNIVRKESGTNDTVRDFQFWSSNLNAVIFRISNTDNVIFDIGLGQVIGKFEGQVLGINCDGSLVAIHPVKIPGSKATDMSKVDIVDLTKYKK